MQATTRVVPALRKDPSDVAHKEKKGTNEFTLSVERGESVHNGIAVHRRGVFACAIFI